MQRLFDAAYLSALTLTFPYWLYQSSRTGKYRRDMSDRLFGHAPPVDQTRSRVWLHAVSLGEVLMTRPLVERIHRDRPDLQLLVSSTTDTGLSVARERLTDATSFRAPLDFSWAVGHTLDQISPSLLVLAELELWPNLLLAAHERNVPICVVNARISERSFRGYKRFRPVLRRAIESVAWWGAQSEEYADRIRRLVGDSPTEIVVTGSMKYDGATTEKNNSRTNSLRKLFQLNPNDRVFVAGSTMAPEEQILIDIWRELKSADPKLKFILVPRHPERFDEVASLFHRENITCVRRSCLHGSESSLPDVILGDTVGELAAVWGLADFGYVGGSLECKRGGQSMIEPAALGVPVCFGPSTANFRVTVEQLLLRQAARQVGSRQELGQQLLQWVKNPKEAAIIGERAQEFIRGQQGAINRTWDALVKRLPAIHRPLRHVQRAIPA
ncbi:3-deoxy-D-manno-octulosonic acid transferase [bacterium]|nr:3-deoxy-D-manno-octulosonic acid transferase [bacterium]